MGGKTVYYTGDTGLFLDMKLIGEIDNIDLMFLPIGDNVMQQLDRVHLAMEQARDMLRKADKHSLLDAIDQLGVD